MKGYSPYWYYQNGQSCTNLLINPAVHNVCIPVKLMERQCILKFVSALGSMLLQVVVTSVHTAKRDNNFMNKRSNYQGADILFIVILD